MGGVSFAAGVRSWWGASEGLRRWLWGGGVSGVRFEN